MMKAIKKNTNFAQFDVSQFSQCCIIVLNYNNNIIEFVCQRNVCVGYFYLYEFQFMNRVVSGLPLVLRCYFEKYNFVTVKKHKKFRTASL